DYWDSPPSTPENPALPVVIKTWICSADARTYQAADEKGNVVAFTSYLGVSGVASGDSAGGLYWGSKVRVTDITDGSSNTFLVGERPPSADLFYGWWFAGSGYDSLGTGDVVLGVREFAYATFLGCPSGKVNFQPGRLSDACDQI